MNQRTNLPLSYSQNFLRDADFVGSLISKTSLGSGDLVVEIGPGTGIITKLLVEKVRKLIVVELDSNLVSDLRNKFHEQSQVDIVQTDFLSWELPKEPFKVFSNIPFYITADTIKKLTENRSHLLAAYLIVQDKAAERFIGQSATRETQISILLKPWFDLSIEAKVGREQFTPRPNVDAVLLKIGKKEKPLVDMDHAQLFRDFVVYGFNQWKPSVIGAFGKIFSHWQKLLIKAELKIDKQKPSEITFDQWLQLFELFTDHTLAEKQFLVKGAEKKLFRQQQNLSKLHRTR